MPFDTPSPTTERPHVVIVGAGFAGLEAAKKLRDAPVQVTLVDRNNYHKFQPLLYEVAMAGLEPDDIAHNVRSIFQGNETVRFRLGTVTDIDPALQQVHLHGSAPMSYDHLILAAGAVSTDFGIPGVKEHAYPLKNVPDAVNLRNRVLRQFERYDRQRDAAGEGALTFVIVGGGPTGVEMAGAFVELFDTLNDDFAAFNTREQARCILLEMENHLLPPYKRPLQAYTRGVLEERGVDVRTGTAVERVEADRVHLDGPAAIPTQTLVWAAGVKASPVAGMMGTEQARDGRLIVRPDLSVPDHPTVYAVGDMAAIEGEDGYEPQLAQVAIQSGRHAAAQIQRAEFAGGISFKGVFAWFLWVVIHIAKLVGFRNRISALVNWAYNYFTYSRSARLILDVVPISDDVPMEVEDVDRQVKERLKTVETQPR